MHITTMPDVIRPFIGGNSEPVREPSPYKNGFSLFIKQSWEGNQETSAPSVRRRLSAPPSSTNSIHSEIELKKKSDLQSSLVPLLPPPT
ncbi:hypothetical protein K443DRAFT_4602 [Laccaria amethystina LaAM-08-1]|uniref:Uncharacterized protein n=1 Tax=Laccaria amethystina LaAM-08-1 TaxID=1095629 RepID=A0A0C9XRZ5_9AGAR|nr:hypothetical protein K443DRAFT_4602 [Laccaria amethystina LaAM-08-1]